VKTVRHRGENVFGMLTALVVCLYPQVCSAAEGRCAETITPVYTHFALSDRTASGEQWDVTSSTNCQSGPLSFSMSSAFVNVQTHSKFASENGQIVGGTDTAVSVAYDFPGLSVFEHEASLKVSTNLNLPTGISELSAAEQPALVDSDLVSLNRYGEGFNLGLGVNAGVKLSNRWIIGFGVGHILKGKYIPDYGGAQLTPGDSSTAVFDLIRHTRRTTSEFNLLLVSEGLSKFDGMPLYRPGDLAVGRVDYQLRLGSRWQVLTLVSVSYSNKSKRYLQQASGEYSLAPAKSGAEFYGAAGVTYIVSPVQNVGLNLSYRDRKVERIDPSLLDYLPKRTIATAGISSTRAFRSGLNLFADVSAKHIKDRPSAIYASQGYNEIGVSLKLIAEF